MVMLIYVISIGVDILEFIVRTKFGIISDGPYEPVDETHTWIERILKSSLILVLLLGIFNFALIEVSLVLFLGISVIIMSLRALMEYRYFRKDKGHIFCSVHAAADFILSIAAVIYLFINDGPEPFLVF